MAIIHNRGGKKSVARLATEAFNGQNKKSKDASVADSSAEEELVALEDSVTEEVVEDESTEVSVESDVVEDTATKKSESKKKSAVSKKKVVSKKTTDK